jgi:phosphoribosylformimino-5-aminoimidazole carboxamide ribotide isomerase
VRIYPAIDIHDGRCVRLVRGDFGQATVYDDDPAEAARRWEAQGAEFLHVVDLDGAKAGVPRNDETIKRIVEAVGIPVQAGGGVRTMDAIRAKLEMGVARVILGTAAVRNPALAREAAENFGERVAAGVDASDGVAAVSAWTELSALKSADLIALLGTFGVKTVVYTDISKDGMMRGPNIEMYKDAAQKGRDPAIIASGGVSTLEDIRALSQTDVEGVIIGKALYVGAVDLREAIRIGKGTE